MEENSFFDLTAKQKEFFYKLKDMFGKKPLPSFEKISKVLGYKSKNSIKQYFSVLKEERLILCEENKFYINPEYFGAKFVLSKVKAGFASVMDDKIEKRISFDNILNLNSPSIFVFKVSGDSMCEVGILDGDYVVIKKTPEAKIGDIVLANIDNEFTLKTYKKDSKGYYLQPENKDYPIIRPKISLSIFGVATGIMRNFT